MLVGRRNTVRSVTIDVHRATGKQVRANISVLTVVEPSKVGRPAVELGGKKFEVFGRLPIVGIRQLRLGFKV